MPHPSVSRPGLRLRGALLALAATALGGCATFKEDVHISPLFSNLSSAGGGREVEALAGIVRVRYPQHDGTWNQWMLRPLASRERYAGNRSLNRFLVPLGTRKRVDDEVTTQLLPIFRFQQRLQESGREAWKLLALPGIFWSQDDTGRVVRAVLPFGGVIEDSFTYERIDFALFPLFARTKREGRTSYHFLWPIFVWSTKPGEAPSWRVWPLYGVNRSEHRDNRFVLWPLFHWHTNSKTRMAERPTRKWMLFPLFGRTRTGSFTSTSLLWPFFGWSSDPESGFWAWDGPWPLVRVQRPGDAPDVAVRTRFWPFYSHFEGDGLESTWTLWPLVNQRSETYSNGTRDGEYVVPFWQRWQRFDLDGKETASWTKLWPIVQIREDQAAARLAVPALNPAWHTPVIDEHYAFVYELYTREWSPGRSRERSWGGLWRRDRDAYESRSYLAGLWGRRRYMDTGAKVTETSLLLGLFRWRAREGRFQGFLPPALPGPGFPIERVASERLRGTR